MLTVNNLSLGQALDKTLRKCPVLTKCYIHTNTQTNIYRYRHIYKTQHNTTQTNMYTFTHA